MASDKSDLEFGLKELLPEGKIRPLLDRTLSLREAADAHAAARVKGNVVLLPGAE